MSNNIIKDEETRKNEQDSNRKRVLFDGDAFTKDCIDSVVEN